MPFFCFYIYFLFFNSFHLRTEDKRQASDRLVCHLFFMARKRYRKRRATRQGRRNLRQIVESQVYRQDGQAQRCAIDSADMYDADRYKHQRAAWLRQTVTPSHAKAAATGARHERKKERSTIVYAKRS